MAYITLTWQEFLQEAKDFLNISTHLGDNWELYEKNKLEGNTFLKCKRKLQLSSPNIEPLAMNNLEENLNFSTDESTVSTKTNEEVFLLEFHIIYSISYQVPMLYLQIQSNDGSIVELEDVWLILGTNDELKTKKRNELLEILTQMEHPVLFKPYYAIHPCKTAELLAQTPQSENRILTFISLMGPYVKLQLDNRYGLMKVSSKLEKRFI